MKEKLATGARLEEFGVEYQLQFACRFRLGLPVLSLQELGVRHELRVFRFSRGSIRPARRWPWGGVGAERA